MSRRKTINDAVDQAGIKWGQDPYRVINAVTRSAAYASAIGIFAIRRATNAP